VIVARQSDMEEMIECCCRRGDEGG
jgi:hypothetical protein